MKIHFGHGVLFFGVLFAGFVIYLVVQMVTQRVDLVEKDYYEQGLNYQSVINNKKNEKVGFKCLQEKDAFTVQGLEKEPSTSCMVVFYRPSDSRLDTTFLITLQGDSGYADLGRLEKGMWRYTLNYKVGGQEFYQQEELYWK